MNDDRRTAVRDARDANGKPFINGIDFLEVDPADEASLVVHFIFNLPDAPNNPVPPNAPGDALTKDDVIIEGGERIVAINVVSATRTADDQLTVVVDRIGDFSTYTLRQRRPNGTPPPGFDPQLCAVDFVFHVECAKRFDCKAELICLPEFTPPPPIDYLAKDYPGFVRVMLDRLALLAPRWQERNPADLGVALVEALAYVGDHLSYRQDAIATEAYLGTARLRTSVRRHARLVDYRLSEGSNARAWMRISVGADIAGGIPKGTRFATGFTAQPPPLLDRSTPSYNRALAASVEFFESMADSGPLLTALKEIPLYSWSASESCLEVGATHATLEGSFPQLKRGMVLILAEAKGPRTGDPDDADPAKRHAVRLVADGAPGIDPVTSAQVIEIDWHPDDALPFPICVSSVTDVDHGAQPITHVSVAWGNIVLADHGRTLGDPLEEMTEAIGAVSTRPGERFRPRLGEGPLTFAADYPYAADALASPSQPIHSAADAAKWAVGDAKPIVTAHSVDLDNNQQDWHAVGDLLDIDTGPETLAFVVEVENDGTAFLRFGDGINGVRPEAGASFSARYRLGVGTRGNVGRDTITLIDSSQLMPAARAAISAVTNPLVAWGGADSETADHVRQSAPVAFRTQQRAVTPEDYRDVALRYPGVRRAAATFRWTGSWHTVFLTVEREAGAALDSRFVAGLEAFVDGYRMAGYDLEVEDALRVPLLIEMHVCVKDGYVAADVARAILEVFSSRVLPDGTLGIFHPDRLNLGQPFYLSPIYARAQAIDGVASVTIVRFERESAPGGDGLKSGVLVPDRLELFVLDNDPNFPERGQFELHADGGL